MGTRKIRSDCTVETLEKKIGLPIGTIRHESGRKMRKDKTVLAIRRDAEKRKK